MKLSTWKQLRSEEMMNETEGTSAPNNIIMITRKRDRVERAEAEAEAQAELLRHEVFANALMEFTRKMEWQYVPLAATDALHCIVGDYVFTLRPRHDKTWKDLDTENRILAYGMVMLVGYDAAMNVHEHAISCVAELSQAKLSQAIVHGCIEHILLRDESTEFTFCGFETDIVSNHLPSARSTCAR